MLTCRYEKEVGRQLLWFTGSGYRIGKQAVTLAVFIGCCLLHLKNIPLQVNRISSRMGIIADDSV